MVRKCKVAGCKREHHAKGYCSKHYQIYRYHGAVVLPEQSVDDLLRAVRITKKSIRDVLCP